MADAGELNPLGDFLRARREAVPPAAVGLPTERRRRVSGLRREEVATLAGVSVNYYIRLERGHDRNPSAEVIDALARALALDDHGARHLHELSHPSRQAAGAPDEVRPGVARLVAGWDRQPALVLSRHMDVLAANALAAALHPGFREGTNLMRFTFCDPRAREAYLDWATVAADSVGSLRAAAGADLGDPVLVDLVEELSAASEEFATLWATHRTHEKLAGRKRFGHPRLGEITLDFESLTVPASAGHVLVVYSAAPGSDEERALELLASTGEPAPAK